MLMMIDTGMSNLRSVSDAFERIGTDVRIARSAADLEAADAIVLPGVGAFQHAMQSLIVQEFIDPLRQLCGKRNKPLLGLCLGMHLLADRGDENGAHEGLGLIPGRVVRLNPTDSTSCRVPNVGWCDVTLNRQCALFDSSSACNCFYFAHSYHFVCSADEDISATIEYGGRITAAVNRDNVFGVQFHPERSQDDGLDLLNRFIRYVYQSNSQIVKKVLQK